MPCYDERGSAEYQYTNYHQPKIDKLTRMLCSTLSKLPNSVALDSETKLWWEEHQLWDIRREAAENRAHDQELKRKQALKKLTAEERKILKL